MQHYLAHLIRQILQRKMTIIYAGVDPLLFVYRVTSSNIGGKGRGPPRLSGVLSQCLKLENNL